MTTRAWLDQSVQLSRNSTYVLRSRPTVSTTLPHSAEALNRLIQTTKPENVLKNDRTTTVVRVEMDTQSMVLKRYNPRNQWHKIKRAFRRSRARNCWDMSFVFQRAGLNVSPPVMMLEKRVGLIRKDAYFANECLAGEELLSALPKMDAAEQAQVQSAVLAAFDKLLAARITHGDMKASNLLWVNNELFFIDLDAAQQHRHWSLSWRRKHNKDRIRFLKNWRNDPAILRLFSGL